MLLCSAVNIYKVSENLKDNTGKEAGIKTD
jgi:hypothetical protein